MNYKTITGQELGIFRKVRGLNQAEFWNRLGVTQSAASRYEAGRRIPESVRILIGIAYGGDVQSILKKLRG